MPEQKEPRKAPSLPWYPRDFEGDEAVKLMTYEQEGIYRRLLDHQWFHMGIPADVRQIAILVPKVPLKRFLALWPGIEAKFHADGSGRLVNPKLERVRLEWKEYRDVKAAAGRASGQARRERNGNSTTNIE